MERGDKYYMAICNLTGMIAIYNKELNLFMSPYADGPLKFDGLLEDKIRIDKITKYGRQFSIVRVPYAFKLLMQELATLNIQMRIITEDNIDQMSSMSFSGSIQDIDRPNITRRKSQTSIKTEQRETTENKLDTDDKVEEEGGIIENAGDFIQETFKNLTTNLFSPPAPVQSEKIEIKETDDEPTLELDDIGEIKTDKSEKKDQEEKPEEPEKPEESEKPQETEKEEEPIVIDLGDMGDDKREKTILPTLTNEQEEKEDKEGSEEKVKVVTN